MNSPVSDSHHGRGVAPFAGVNADTTLRYRLKPLERFLQDESVTEIAVNRPGEIWTESHGGWMKHDAPNMTYDDALRLGTAAASFIGDDWGATQPVISATMPDGERAQFVMPNACEKNTIAVTLRKPSFHVRKMEEYEEGSFFSHVRTDTQSLMPHETELLQLKDAHRYREFLGKAIEHGKVIVVAGETGSGKTTFMKTLCQLIPPANRIVTIEDVAELSLPNHPNRVHLFYPSNAGNASPVTSQLLLKSCLRMKPDRILLTELRGPETYDFINVCASGHEGSITSCHAGTSDTTFERLVLMAMQNPQGRELPYQVLLRLLYMTVDVVVCMTNKAPHGRHITELWYDPMKKRLER
jgi:type IV secretion system protein VirB11